MTDPRLTALRLGSNWHAKVERNELELKTENGRLTETQERTLAALRDAGTAATQCHQALQILERWGLLRGHAT
jgi:hypothetical protein